MNKIFGVVVGLVTDNKDPKNAGRVKLKFPWLDDNLTSHWARIASPMAGKDRGFMFMPEIDDEVLVAFMNGDVNHPCVIGALWNGMDLPPMKNEDIVTGGVNHRRIKTRYGHILDFEDTDMDQRIVVQTPGGQRIVLYDGMPGGVSIVNKEGREFFSDNMGQIGFVGASGHGVVIDEMKGYVTVYDKVGNHVTLNASSVDVSSTMTVNIKAGATVNVQGSMVNINSGPAMTQKGSPDPNKEKTKEAKKS